MGDKNHAVRIVVFGNGRQPDIVGDKNHGIISTIRIIICRQPDIVGDKDSSLTETFFLERFCRQPDIVGNKFI